MAEFIIFDTAIADTVQSQTTLVIDGSIKTEELVIDLEPSVDLDNYKYNLEVY